MNTPDPNETLDALAPDNRRVEERLTFHRECQVQVRSPTWAVLPSYLVAETRNITTNGVLVSIDGFSRPLFARWAGHLRKGETIGVIVRLIDPRQTLELPGEIVWTLFREQEVDNPEGICEAGVYLSLLSPESERALIQIIRELKQ